MEPVHVLGVHVDPRTTATVMLLGDAEAPTRVLPVFIGPAEAQAIMIALAGIELPRPGTHDLFIDTLVACGVHLEQVAVTALVEGTFLAEARLVTPTGSTDVSARPSDAIALALRAGVPVLVDDGVFEEAAVDVEHEANQPFDDDEIEAIVSDFEEFLATATPEDFGTSPDLTELETEPIPLVSEREDASAGEVDTEPADEATEDPDDSAG